MSANWIWVMDAWVQEHHMRKILTDRLTLIGPGRVGSRGQRYSIRVNTASLASEWGLLELPPGGFMILCITGSRNELAEIDKAAVLDMVRLRYG
jgi:hypothetical protein